MSRIRSVAVPLAKSQRLAGWFSVFILHRTCHAAHASTERPAAFGGFGSRFQFGGWCCHSSLQFAAWILGTIRCHSSCIQAACGRLACLACPCCGFSDKFVKRFHAGDTFLPLAPCIPTRDFSACFCFNRFAPISPAVLGVLLLILRVGRQYSFSPPAPQAAPDLVSRHRSAPHRFRFAPPSVLRTSPLLLRHLAVACAARADHLP
jgi:hypothetical protein